MRNDGCHSMHLQLNTDVETAIEELIPEMKEQFLQYTKANKCNNEVHMRWANQQVGENGGTPRKTTWHTPKQNLAWLTCGQCGARTRTRHNGEMIE